VGATLDVNRIGNAAWPYGEWQPLVKVVPVLTAIANVNQSARLSDVPASNAAF